MNGMVSSHQRTPGSENSPTMLSVWSVTSTVVTSAADTMTRITFPMVVQNVKDVKMMIWTDTTVKTQSRELSKSLLVSVSGLRDTSHNAPVNVNTNTKSTE